MNGLLLSGLAMVLAAGLMNGSFAVPMKWTREWAWENTWLAWSLVGLLLFPFALTLRTVPAVFEIYRQSDPGVLLRVCLCGAAWGISQVLFGLGIRRAGVALGFAIVVGLAAATGSLVPLWLLQAGNNAGWSMLIAGIAIILAGVGLCSYAGQLKDGSNAASDGGSRSGVLLCVAAGLGGSMINVGMVAGAPLAALARSQGVAPVHSTNAIWMPLLFSGFLATSIYCAWLLTRNGHWRSFTMRGERGYWLLATLMAVCWFGSVELYGIAAARLGEWGPVLGWPIFLSASIATANVWGLATGEWRHAAVRPRRFMLAGVSMLIVAIFFIGLSSRIEH